MVRRYLRISHGPATPDRFPDLMAAAIQGRDLGHWASEQGLSASRAGPASPPQPHDTLVLFDQGSATPGSGHGVPGVRHADELRFRPGAMEVPRRTDRTHD